METQVKLGLNRTGIAMSPLDIKKMVADDEATAPADITLLRPYSPIREEYFAEDGRVGTVPIPASLKGMWESGKSLLSGDHPQVLIDKLGERLAFERSGVRLYGALLAKCSTLTQSLPDEIIEKLQHFQREEQQHFQLLADCMTEIGADPTAETPCADVSGVESSGLVKVITDPRTTLTQSLHALLTVELVDQVGWEELIELARTLGREQIAERFAEAEAEERVHLVTVRRWFSQLTLAEAQGQAQAAPRQLQ